MIVGIVSVIIKENRSPVRALPWLLVVLLVPVGGVLLYLYFGVDVRRVNLLGRKAYKQLRKLPEYMPPPDSCSLTATSISLLLQNSTGHSLTYASQLQLFTSWQQYLQDLLDTFSSAQHSIYIQGYQLERNLLFEKILPVLQKKASQGVQIVWLYDKVGCRSIKKKEWKQLERLGIIAKPFMSVYLPYFANRFNYRNHRKVIVVDGTVGYMGNVDLNPQESLPTLGLQLRVTGGAVAALLRSFFVDCLVARVPVFTESTDASRLGGSWPWHSICQEEEEPAIPMQIVPTSPTDRWSNTEQALSTAFLRAKKQIDMVSTAFIPTQTVQEALRIAAKSGVVVRLLLPNKFSSRMLQIATYSYAEELKRAGAQVYIYQPTTHFRMQYMTIDGEYAIAGTSRTDFRSFENNFELNAFIYHEVTTMELSAMFQSLLKQAKQLPSSGRERLSPRDRIRNRSIRLITPLL